MPNPIRGTSRRTAKSWCLLVAEDDKSSAVARERLAVMLRTRDGFVLAEADPELRGPGEFLSGAATSLAQADALVRLPGDAAGFEAGTLLETPRFSDV